LKEIAHVLRPPTLFHCTFSFESPVDLLLAQADFAKLRDHVAKLNLVTALRQVTMLFKLFSPI
jgi:hypothetical protein